MKKLDLKKGFKTTLAGAPDISVIKLAEPDTVAVSAMDIPFIRPKLLVRENDLVKIGAPVFCDKRNRRINYVSCGAGRVKQIVYGPRRRLKEVVISLSKPIDPIGDIVQFDPLSENALVSAKTSQIVRMLQEGGLWQCLRAFPSKDTADETRKPSMIIVSMNGNDLFSPDPGVLLDGAADTFQYGLKLLTLFCENIVVTARQSCLDRLNGFHTLISHTVNDFYPAWDPGVVLYQLKQSEKDNLSWRVSAEHLILMAEFLSTGQYPVKKIVTISRSHDPKPHILTRQGVPVKDLIGSIGNQNIVTTGLFNGRSVDVDTHLGFFENTLNVIKKGPEASMFGFMTPGFSTPSESKTYVSAMVRKQKTLDCNIHGEQRACINCGYCIKICPVDLLPNFIMKALISDDMEDALSYGLLDCARCGLCAYACPSKIELVDILSNGMDAHYKDKE